MKKIYALSLVALVAAGCNFLDPLENGSYNEDNYSNYPEIVRGFIDKAYNKLPDVYYATEFIGTDAISDDAVYTSSSNTTHLFSIGSAQIASNPFSSIWTRDYEGIYYCNLFLKDDVGRNTHYLLDAESDEMLKQTLQGDAYALRAWYEYDLLKTFGGQGPDTTMLGIPLFTEAVSTEELDVNTVTRATFDQTVKQILSDCDEAYKYLPYNNRDYPGDKKYITPVVGSVRYKLFDQVTIDCLRAMTYLLWASPAFCQDAQKAQNRYAKAAEYASKAIRHKLDKESTLGFDPKARFLWADGNSPEAYIVSNVAKNQFETNLYPQNFGGVAAITPTQDLVDAFPMANGYPITDSRSGYDPKNPYVGRDPRFYSTIFYNGSEVRRNTNNELMYTFASYAGGKDAPRLTDNGLTSYFVKKFVSLGWNPYDASVAAGYKSVFFMRWEQMLLIFAEAANKAVGPTTAINGLTAREALSLIRSRNTNDDMPGLGAEQDPYLDECARSQSAFEALVKNEWRLNTCFEGFRYYNLRRWTANREDLSAINVPVHGVDINEVGGEFSYTVNTIETKSFPSLWNPLPYTEVRKCPNLLQNKGWESWK